MVEQEQIARWIIGLAANETADAKATEFLAAVRLGWPRVLAHARRELAGRNLSSNEITSVTFEVWEEVLRSVWNTLCRPTDTAREIHNLENYLIGIFHHRFNRRLKYKRSRDAILEFLPPEKFEALTCTASIDDTYAARMHQSIQMDQVYDQLDEKIRKALVARIYGFSWGEIARHFEIEEQNLVMRVRYAIRKVRENFTRKRS